MSSEAPWSNPRTGHAGSCRVWEPPTVRHELVLIHGFGEHSGRYEALARRFAAQGVRVTCADLWGHGRSGGRRGDVERFDAYLSDLESLPTSGTPHLFGHSLGGLLAIHLAQRAPQRWASLTLQSPLLRLGFPVPWWKELLARLAAYAAPTLTLADQVNPAWLSRNPEVGRRYMADPLVHQRISVRAYSAIQRAAAHARASAGAVTLPTLLMYGTGDHVVSPKACADFFERLACDKHVVVFREAYHELHHEPEIESVVSHVLSWMSAHA